ncbi:MAG TPA: DUF4421 family protein [Flavobacteriales bacterium]|nr:DUF4421 family protein [Flavobacteriales bacterium]HMR26569.1 DUF4421 family protein [Flavobacteriales bacterium]
MPSPSPVLRALLCGILLAGGGDTAGQAVEPPKDSAQVEPAPRWKNYFEPMNHLVALRVALTDDPEVFDLQAGDVRYAIDPNIRTALKFSFAYRVVSFSAGWAPTFLPGNADNALRGRTRHHRYAFTLMPGHLTQVLAYTRTKGYYLANTSDFIPGWRKDVDPYIQFPDLVYTSFFGQTGYRTDRRLSFNALVSQGERQRKSAGTFMPLLSYHYYELDDRTYLTGTNSSQRSRNIEVVLSATYVHCFVFLRNAYVALGGGPGIGYLHTDLLTRLPSGDVDSDQRNILYRADLSAALGYNGERFFGGGQFVGSREQYDQENTVAVVIKDRYYFQVFLGVRFGAPRPLRWMVDRAEEQERRGMERLKRMFGRKP